MKIKKVAVKLENDPHDYTVKIGNDLLETSGVWTRECLPSKTKKIALVSNPKVFRLYGEAVINSFKDQGFQIHIFLMKDGEKYKNLRTLESLLEFLGEKKLTRADAVVALGGGVVGDLAGFAAAIFLRGIVFLQIPTTFLAMIDSSVGGKTGVNSGFGKNLVGAFHQPHGVLIDVGTLKTLPRRELIAGFCEAVKQAAIANRNLFDQTSAFTRDFPLGKFKSSFSDEKFVDALEHLIAAQIAFKAKIVMQDEKEDTERSDGKSRKILNFGHTLAHALEKVTDYKRFKHGEAVGYGIMFAAELSKKLEILGENDLDLLNDVLQRLGELPNTQNINLEKVSAAFAFDKKVIGKSLQWVLLQKIGEPIIFDSKDIPPAAINETLKKVLQI